MANLTPMMRQFLKIKEEHKDSIVFYRLGDFYEMFFEDALVASKILDLVLTGRDCGLDEKAPMCGIPFHSCEGYISKLVASGHKVAICEQLEEPSQAKGIVRREVVRTISKGTVTESSMLQEGENNFLASVHISNSAAGLCFADITTGEIFVTSLFGRNIITNVINDIDRYSPKEVILNTDADKTLIGYLNSRADTSIEFAGIQCDLEQATNNVQARFENYDISEILNLEEAVFAVNSFFRYLVKLNVDNISSINRLSVYTGNQFMELDITARRNLELCETIRARDKRSTLLWVLNNTKTAMGTRLLRQWMEHPLLNVQDINKRLCAVGWLYENRMKRDSIQENLRNVSDIERIIARVAAGRANARDIVALERAFRHIPSIKSDISNSNCEYLREAYDNLDELLDVTDLVCRAINEDPPFSVKEGGIIKPGYNTDVDELRKLSSGGREKILEIENREKQRTGIKSLKVGYSRVFGYYIEITKACLSQVPEDYKRKQTLANCERYIIDELKKYEDMVLSAQEKLANMEHSIFCDIMQSVTIHLSRIQKTAHAISIVDVVCSLASVAEENNYVRPEVSSSDGIEILDGRHPVVEKMVSDGGFIPNDILLDCNENNIAIITGPNMAGKSTYMRQAAIITIMAQIGSFVPARSAKIGIVDKIFTRIGASDDLSNGQSTFMIEMSEVAHILENATNKSLIILDEIGRGTSTYDGMSIARAIIEHISNSKIIGAKTMFATHYHELTELEEFFPNIKNYNIVAKKDNGSVVFLRKVVPGGADDSFGIEVAKLAGVHIDVIARAEIILRQLESGNMPQKSYEPVEEADSFMGDKGFDRVFKILDDIDINNLTPMEALNMIYEMKKIVN